MAEFDWTGFADAVRLGLADRGCSLGAAVGKWPATDKAMWHRACHAKTLTPGNLLVVCDCLDIDPFAYVDDVKRRRVTRKAVVKQAVTRSVPRETSLASRAEGAPAGRATARGVRSDAPPVGGFPGGVDGSGCGP